MRDLLSYHRWATQRTLEACAALTDEEWTRDLGGGFPSVRLTLAHLWMAENAWAHRVRGETYTRPPPGELPAALETAWLGLLDTWEALLNSRDADEPISYHAFDGTPYQSRFSDIVRHVVNHASYHRGQIANMLRVLGKPVPGTDYIAFTRAATKPV